MYFDAQPPIERPVLHLARPDRKVIARLSEVQDETENFNLGQLTELTFSVPLKYETLEENKINLNAQKLLERMLIRLRSEGEERWYIISSRNIDVDSKKAMITAKSTAYTLSDIPIKAFSTVENENPDGLGYSSWTLSEIIRETVDRDEDTMWRLGDVDVDFDLKRREFTHDGSLGELVVAVAEKFGAIPIYDDLNSKIHFKHPDKIGRNRGLKLSYDNYLLSMSKDTNSDSLATQLALYGSEGLTIREINPTGSTYIEDFSYFLYPYQEDTNGNVIKSSFFMSDSLAGAITRYSKKIVTLTPSFQTILTQLETLTQQIFDLETSLSIQDTLLIQKQEQIDIWLGTNDGKSNATYEAEKKVIVTEMTRLQGQINSRMTQIASLAGNDYFDTSIVELGAAGGQLGLLKEQLLVRNNFTAEQIKERSYYVIRKEWSNDSITEAKDLLEEGRKAFKDFSKPSLNMNLSVIDFLSSLETPFAHKQLYLGDSVRTEDDWEHRVLEGKILGFTRNYYEKSLSLQIANFTKEEDGADKFLKMIYQASFAATVVNDNKYKWDLSKENNGTLNAIINDNFDAVKKKVTGGAAGLTEFSARGLTSRDYSDNSKYLVVQNGVLALTKDNGVNWGVAITPDGIVAERVMGKLIAGVNVTIEDKDGIMRILGNKLSISNRNKEEVVKIGLVSPPGQADRFGMIVDNRKNQIGIVDNEGFYISRYIGDTIEKLLWTDVDGNLNAQKITATDMKIVNGDMKSGVVKNSSGDNIVQFGTFGMKIDSGSLIINGGLSDANIRSATVWSAKETPEGAQEKVDAAKEILEGQITDANLAINEVSEALDGLEGDINSTFKDGLINEAESLSIKSNLSILENDKQELNLEFTKIYNSTSLDASSKSSLNTAQVAYTTAHTNLVNKINNSTTDNVITDTERNEVSSFFQTYRDKIADFKTKISDAWNVVAVKTSGNYTDAAKTNLEGQINSANAVISTLNSNLGTFENTVNTTFKDSLISSAEALSIKSNIETLNIDKASLEKEYNTIYPSSWLDASGKTTLKNAYDAYVLSHTDLISAINTATSDSGITQAERDNVQSKFGLYRTKLSALTTTLSDTWNIVSTKTASSYTDTVKSQIDTSISGLSGNLTAFQNTVTTTFKDGLINESEALSIKSNVEVLESSKSGLVSQYNNVYTNSLLIDPQKSELKTAYDNFITAHTAVINAINTATSDKAITEAERADVTAKFTTYRTRLSELNTKLDAAWKAVSDKFASNTAKTEADAAYNNAVGAIVDKMNIEADLPTSLSFGNYGMRATTSDPNIFAQFDYRGLYIKGGAIQIDAGSNGIRLNSGEGLVIDSSKMRISMNATEGIKMWRKTDSKDVFAVDSNGRVVLQDVLIKSGAIQWDSLASAPSWTDMTGKPTYLGSDRIYSPTIQGGTIEGALFKSSNYVSNDGVLGVMTLDSQGMLYKATVNMADANYPKREYYTAYGMSRLELSSESKHLNGTFKDQEIDRVTLASNSHLIITSKRKGSNSNDLLTLAIDKTNIEGNLTSTLPLSIDAPVINVDAGDIKASFDVYARTFYQNNSKVATEAEVDNRINNKLDKGRVTVTVVNGGQAGQFSVAFNKTFSSPPIVTVAANTTIIGSTVTGAAVTGITTTGCTIWANRTSPGDVAVNWIAVG